MSKCCDGSIGLTRERFVINSKSLNEPNRKVLRTKLNGDQNVVEFKALAKRAGLSRKYDVKVGIIGSNSRIGQAIQAIGSAAIPGNVSPYRSPVRSAVFSAITPGKPRIPGGTGGANRASRCPEGYQYGGRFTDSRLSTCGAQLFDIPSVLGASIAVIKRIARGARAIATDSTPVTGEAAPDSLINARRPQIPRVSNPNPKAASINSKEIIRLMSQMSTPSTRLVRKDGFVLEPVVPAQVLRAIPDNRDMEGANYIMLATQLPDLGGQELGLLSNTGVTKLTYVLPGGSTLTLEKRRPLTVGERRKLGRTVNAAAKIDISKDPTARLKEVVLQTGDGIGYSESFVNIKNPNEQVVKGGKTLPKWADEIYGKGKKARSVTETARETDSVSAVGKTITSLDDAVSHISSGGSLAEIDPSILQQAISKANIFKRQKLDATREIITAPDGRKYIQYSSSSDFEHIAQKFSSDMQQHLGLESPDVFFVGTGDKRKYITEEPGTFLRGFSVDRRKTMKDYSPEDVARMMVSDWLTDQRDRTPGSVISLSNSGQIRPVMTTNTTSSLIDLDKVEITKRQKMSIDDFFSGERSSSYVQYFKELQQQQKFAFKKEIDALLLRARRFNFTQFKNRLYSDGKLSEAEKTHLNIIGRILEQRIETYASSKDTIMKIIGAN
jgi:hypothetical protein